MIGSFGTACIVKEMRAFTGGKFRATIANEGCFFQTGTITGNVIFTKMMAIVSGTKPASFHADGVTTNMVNRTFGCMNTIVASRAVSFGWGSMKFYFSGNSRRTFAKNFSHSSKTNTLLEGMFNIRPVRQGEVFLVTDNRFTHSTPFCADGNQLKSTSVQCRSKCYIFKKCVAFKNSFNDFLIEKHFTNIEHVFYNIYTRGICYE